MIFSWHVIPLIPISFPLTENWESWVNLKLNVLWSSLGVTWTDVSNIIIIIESVNVSGQRNSHAINCILSMTWIDMWHIVNSWKLTINSSSFVEYVEIFINWYLTPMGYIYISRCLWKFWKWIWICKEKLDLLKL
jgi:hypothetical protein